jgi:hypothetical protein
VTHPALVDFARGARGVSALLEAWREERTSELADAIEILEPLDAVDDFVHRIASTRWNESWTYDEAAYAARAKAFEPFTREIARLRDHAPDPRIGRTVERAIRNSHSDNWFHADQVAHVIGRFPVPPGARTPSFADHAFALLETHGDAGTPAPLEALASDLMIEAGCNEAEMASRLRELAQKLRDEHPYDVKLDAATAERLRAP